MSIAATFQELRTAFDSGVTRPLKWRLKQITQIEKMVKKHRHEWEAALHADLGKAGVDAHLTEISQVLGEISHTRKHLASWMRDTKAKTPLTLAPGRSWVRHDPLGVVLIISPWNYPLQLQLSPLVGAFAGGNTVVLKPSEVASHTEKLVAKLVPQYFDRSVVQVITGGPEVVSQAIAQKPNHVFFTGSTPVGKIIAEQCGKHLIPTTLELGGKSPTYVHKDANLKTAARRIVWGKFTNAGQTCVAPDHIYVHRKVAKEFTKLLVKEIKKQYGKAPHKSAHYGRIITEKHAQRLNDLIVDGLAFGSAAGGAKKNSRPQLLCGGNTDVANRYIDPTVITGVTEDNPLMAEEIFGPILPVITVRNFAEAAAKINLRPQPLAFYVFAKSRKLLSEAVDTVSSGGVAINAPLVHLATPYLPFGGVGESGLGNYHGKWSFETFTHERAVLKKNNCPDTIKLIAAPVGRVSESIIRRFM
ncbi:aldehyde dehydrogenase family protein [Canibacter zhoujuaniae]|uniref:aldehyde dehydrogenase family protein n=1 Tax=Canibacter zhoujuaniae TaxID=2708343 RepID=UPI0014211E31|nr:aldehyde dehydrogenase family protein [Canibacter zhoujuaniae]